MAPGRRLRVAGLHALVALIGSEAVLPCLHTCLSSEAAPAGHDASTEREAS
jgi:hypothetical protein